MVLIKFLKDCRMANKELIKINTTFYNNHSNKYIKYWHVNNKFKYFHTWAITKDIQIEPALLYTKELNRVIKQFRGYINKIARTIIINSSLSINL